MSYALSRMKRGMRRLTHRVGVLVTAEWVERTGGTLDPVTGTTYGGTSEIRTQTPFKALKHDVTSKMAERMYAEMQVGDVILDCNPADLVDGRDYTGFLIAGVRYTPQTVGPQLTRAWDAQFGAVATCRTLLLRRAP